jgi:hypothetical protein
MNYIDYFDGFTLVRCVCVWCGVYRNRKWVLSYVKQYLVPTNRGGSGHWPCVLPLISFVFGGCVKNESQIFILTPLLQRFNSSMVCPMFPYSCLSFNMCSAYVETTTYKSNQKWPFAKSLYPTAWIAAIFLQDFSWKWI